MQVTRKNFQVQLWSYEHIDPIYSKIDCVDGGGIVAGVGIVVGGVVVGVVVGGGVVVVVVGGGGEFSGDGGWYISLHQNNPLLVLVE